jgi:MbtH protein
MSDTDSEDAVQHLVVVNHEEQYSIWPQYRDLPAGWEQAGFNGTKAECLEHIGKVWTDMRPLSLRESLESGADADASGA